MQNDALPLKAEGSMTVLYPDWPAAEPKPKRNAMTPSEINPAQREYALAIARQACARIFRDGGTPGDAMEAFGLVEADGAADWQQAVETIARALCKTQIRRAA